MKIQECLSRIQQEISTAVARVDAAECERLTDAIENADRIFVAGLGRSGLMTKAFAMRLVHLGFRVHVVGETTTPNITEKDLLIIGSGSGETGSLITIAARAAALNVETAVLTINPGSTVAQRASIVVRIPATTAKTTHSSDIPSIQPRGSLFEQSLLLVFEAVVLYLMERRGMKLEDVFTLHANLE